MVGRTEPFIAIDEDYYLSTLNRVWKGLLCSKRTDANFQRHDTYLHRYQYMDGVNTMSQLTTAFQYLHTQGV